MKKKEYCGNCCWFFGECTDGDGCCAKHYSVMHVKREIQIRQQNFNQLQELSKEGVIAEWSFDMSRTPTFSVRLSDNYTIVEDDGWLIQDTEGRWWGMDSGYHRMLEEYKKIVIER